MPAATPRPITNKLNATVNQVLGDPDTIARGHTLGLRIGGGPPERLKHDPATDGKMTNLASLSPHASTGSSFRRATCQNSP